MNEKIYKTMSATGVSSLILGIIAAIAGVVTGVLMIINGARLLKRKSEFLPQIHISGRTFRQGIILKNETKRMIRQGGVILFGIYVILLIYFLFFSKFLRQSCRRRTDIPV